MRMAKMDTKIFGGKKFILKARQHSKRSAWKFAKEQRAKGKHARITSDKWGGHLNYNVWVR